jgi:hypothetical protein
VFVETNKARLVDDLELLYKAAEMLLEAPTVSVTDVSERIAWGPDWSGEPWFGVLPGEGLPPNPVLGAGRYKLVWVGDQE